MDDNEITAIVGWPTEPEMAKYRKVAAAAVAEERERWAAVLAASCDEERSQMWEAGPGGGCSRAIAAETEIERLRAALKRMDRMRGMMMAQANHGASCYDAGCIHEMNGAPIQAARALGPNV